MSVKDEWPETKCFGSATVGPRGQVVIPVNARKELGIDTGTTLLAFEFLHGRGLVLLKADTVEQMLSMMSERLASFEELLKTYQSPKAASGKERST